MSNPGSNLEVDELVEKLRRAAGLETPHAGELSAWRSSIEKQAEMFDGLGNRYKLKAAELREKVRAVDVLLGTGQAGDVPAKDATVQTSTRRADSSDSAFTPVEVYWPPIIESLIELGGAGSREEVIERVGKKLEPILTHADWELVPSGGDVRWKNRAAWQRLNMVKRGLLRDDSRRGTWEVTPEGHKWLSDTNQQLVILQAQLRMAGLCRQSDPNCETRVAAARVPGHFRLKVTSGSTVLINPDMDISYADLGRQSDDELWDFLESISNRRVRRPLG